MEDPNYRNLNLAANNIFIRPLYEPPPQHVTTVVEYMRRDRDSPGPSPEQLRQDTELNELFMGTGEPEVETYFKDNILPKPGALDSLKRSERQPMVEHSVPNTSSKFKVSTPVQDLPYGYNRGPAFPRQQAQLISMGAEPVANTAGLLYPFFVVEFSGDGGSMLVATNQCLGGSASCVKMAEDLNRRLKHCTEHISRVDIQLIRKTSVKSVCILPFQMYSDGSHRPTSPECAL